MGKDYRHKTKNKIHQFDEDGYDGDHKLQKYDRDKTRKRNKLNLNHIDINSLTEEWSDYDVEGEQWNRSH